MLNLRFDKGFFEFLTGRKKKMLLVILAIGLLLIIIGSFGAREPVSGGEELEERVSELCSMTSGVGECRVMITYEADGETVFGVAVLCEGAESSKVRSELNDMLSSLFGIGTNRISILKIN